MPLIPERIIDEIQARVDIAEVVGRSVPLTRAGRYWKAPCPFHKERTPSFMVNTEKQIFHCFGCGVGGNVFSFLMQHEQLTFPEAVRQMADQLGIIIPDQDGESHRANRERTERLFALTEKACRYFERLLAHPVKGKEARAYLQRRGVSEDVAQRFRLGYTQEGWRHFMEAAATSGVSSDELEQAGLVIKHAAGSSYDRFRHRLMFPILDVRGRVVGFGGRTLGHEEPKYLNSPETPLYRKGEHLFGLSQAKEAIRERQRVVLVEGYFDCVVLVAAGIREVVSPLGTALTHDQARLLTRYTERVILAFDPDAAGEQATLRGIEVLVEAGLDVAVATLEPGIDPDEWVQAHGREAFEQRLSGAANIFEFLFEVASRRYPMTSVEGKAKAAQWMLPSIAKVPDTILRSEYVRLLANRLDLDESSVVREFKRVTTSATASPGSLRRPIERTEDRASVHGPERLLAALVLEEPARWARIEPPLMMAEMRDATAREILSVVEELVSGTPVVQPSQVVSRLSERGRAEQAALVTELVEWVQTIPSKESALEECVGRIRAAVKMRSLHRLREELRVAQETKQEERLQQLLAEYQRQLKGGIEHD